MDAITLGQIALKWGRAVGDAIKYCPPEARYITGDAISDAQFHYFEQDSGIVLKLSDDFNKIIGYNVIDEAKFTLFLLRWS